MKIKTEVLKSIYIVTCEGSDLNPVLIQGFVTAMKGFIQKQQLDILLDLSGVESVDSTKLGSVIQFLEQIEGGDGLLILCGVSDRVINLLKMTNMDGKFIQADNRNSALSNLFWEKKKTSAAKTSPEPEASVTRKETPQFEMEKEAEDADEVMEVDEYEIIEDGWEIVDEEGVDEVEEFGGAGDKVDEKSLASVYEVRTEYTAEARKKALRKFPRIKSRQISDDELVMYCKNLATGKHHTAVILDISLGGLLVKLRPAGLMVGEELLLKGRIGKGFKFNEHAVACSYCGEGKYGLAFVELSQEAKQFLTRLIGAVK
ncbi:MAG: PilZ domain-containing protein [Desulfocapsa sp.]|nr:PilZ domain-containing protein [Desulfocapsa sp.]